MCVCMGVCGCVCVCVCVCVWRVLGGGRPWINKSIHKDDLISV